MSTVEKVTQYDSINGQKLVFKSYVNKKKLKYIIENYESLQNKTSIRMGHEYAERQLKMAKEMYKNIITDASGETYIISTFEQKDSKRGRYFSDAPSLQNISREIRHTIAEKYIDIDIKNAHPFLLLDYCNKNNIHCPSLHDYVNNRQSYFDDLKKTMNMSKSEAKMHIITMMNADMNEVLKHSDKMNNLRREFFSIRNQIIVQQKDIYDYVVANPKEDEVINGVSLKSDNINGRTLNHLLCDLENQVLMTTLKKVVTMEYKTKKGEPPVTYEIGAPIHDGFMMLINGTTKEDIKVKTLIGCILSETIKEKLNIANIVFEEKAMNEGWDITPEMLETVDTSHDDLIYDEKMLERAIYGDHKETAELFKALYGQENIRIINHEKQAIFYHWNQKTLLWEEESGLSFIKYFSILNKLFEKHKKEAERDLFNCKKPEYAKNKEQAQKLKEDYETKHKSLKNKVKEITTYLKKLSNVGFLKSCKDYYVSYSYDKEFELKLNRNIYELPIAHGHIINLKTKEIKQRTRNNLFSFSLDVSYTENEDERTHAYNFFSSLCCNNEDFTKYLIKFLGYSLSGDLSDSSINIFYGSGSNGKSTLFEIMKKMLKKYYTTLSESVMIKTDKRTSATPELIPLKDARLSVLSETNENEALNESRLKSITGGDEISARDLYKSQITFHTQSKMVLVTNNLPQFNINDGGMMRRIRLFPFINKFTRTAETDAFIEDIKTKYLNSVFSLLIDAGADYHNGNRLKICDFMQTHLKEYISELDHETQFFEDNYNIITEEQYKASSNKRSLVLKRTDVYKHFQEFLRENGINRKYTQKQFTELCTRKNIILKTLDGNNYICVTSKNTDNVLIEL